MVWSIRAKFLFVMTSLLGACLIVCLALATSVFKTDKTELVYDLNRSQVTNLSSEIDTQFESISEKLKLFAILQTQNRSHLIQDLFTDKSDVVQVELFRLDQKKTLYSFTQKRFLETYGITSDFFEKVKTAREIPFQDIMVKGESIWNATIPEGPPLIGYGRSVVVENDKGVAVDQMAVISFIKPDQLLKAVSLIKLSETTIVSARGEVLVMSKADQLATRPTLNQDSLFQQIQQAKTKTSVISLELNDEKILAAYSKTYRNHIFVITKAKEREAFKVVRDLMFQWLLFGSIVLTSAVLASFLISRSLTKNLGRLVERMELASTGDLSTPVDVRGNDETKILATTFNDMIHDLKESRDALEKMNQELDQKVKERTVQLEEQNKKVKEAQEALLRTTRLASVGEIAGRAAHEVLNPLTSLLARVGVIEKKINGEYQQNLSLFDDIRLAWKKDLTDGGFKNVIENWQKPSQLNAQKNLFQEDLENLDAVSSTLRTHSQTLLEDTRFLKDEGGRISRIVNGMRKLGNLQSELKPHSVHSILNDCCDIMADLFDQHNFKLHKDFKASDDQCRLDRDEMIQAVTNLMRNSLHALEVLARTKQERAVPSTLTLRTFNRGQHLCIDIEDNGVGVDKKDQAKLFGSSFTTKSPEEGTGLGLGISRRFVRNSGGEIEFVESEPLVKTIFRIVLPVYRAQQGAVA